MGLRSLYGGMQKSCHNRPLPNSANRPRSLASMPSVVRPTEAPTVHSLVKHHNWNSFRRSGERTARNRISGMYRLYAPENIIEKLPRLRALEIPRVFIIARILDDSKKA